MEGGNMASFREKWLAAVEKKNSVLCAGLDPAEYDLGRGEEGLPYLIDKREWTFRYLETVAPHVAALKINVNYWKQRDDMETIAETAAYASSELGLVIIDDSKLADISSTNEAGIYHSVENNFDAVTLAPFAGNMKEAAEQARKWEIGLISMCMMSNPEYEMVKNDLVQVNNEDHYYSNDIINVVGVPRVRKYMQLAHDAAKYGLDGIVVGAPSKKNHITEAEIQKVRKYSRDDTLVLLPGIGAQGGEAEAIWKYFDKDAVIVNVGRALMFPQGSNSTPAEQADAAKHYQKMLNKLRVK